MAFEGATQPPLNTDNIYVDAHKCSSLTFMCPIFSPWAVMHQDCPNYMDSVPLHLIMLAPQVERIANNVNY